VGQAVPSRAPTSGKAETSAISFVKFSLNFSEISFNFVIYKEI
jgi:hypothetical protein